MKLHNWNKELDVHSSYLYRYRCNDCGWFFYASKGRIQTRIEEAPDCATYMATRIAAKMLK